MTPHWGFIVAAFAVAAATHYLIGLPWNVGFLLGAIVAQIAALVPAEHHAIGTEQASLRDLLRLRPTRGTIGLDVLRLPRAPDRHTDRDGCGDESA